MAVIALDLGGTKLSAALFNSEGGMTKYYKKPLGSRVGAQVGELLQQETARLMTAAEDAGQTVTGLGVCVPGISYERTGKVWAPNIPGWEEYPLRQELRNALKACHPRRQKLPGITIENDRACYILGEQWKGAAQGCRNAICMAVGTGIGAGLLVNGRVVNGAHGTAGSIGWLALKRPFLSEYEMWGCFEHHASGAGIARAGTLWKRATGIYPDETTAAEVFHSFDRDEPMGRKVIGEAIQFWGMATANLLSLFDPEVIVFGGGVFGPGKRLLKDIRAEAERWAQPIAMKDVRLLGSKLGGDAGLYGAAKVALG